MNIEKKSFHSLFNKYRLQGGIESLSELGELLAEKQIVYDESIFSKWKRGERIPRDRHVLLALLSIFVEKQSLRTIEEINKFLQSADVRQLTETEEKKFKQLLHVSYPFSVPDKISPQVIREKYLKDICWKILNNSSVILSGMPGNGKTAIAITAAHTLRQSFFEGVYWFQCSQKPLTSIFDSIGSAFGHSTTQLYNLTAKVVAIKKILDHKKVFIILDDLSDINDFISLFPTETAGKYVFLITTYRVSCDEPYACIHVRQFTRAESLILAEKILGVPFVATNRAKLESLFKMVGNSPLALSLLMKRLEQEPLKLDYFLSQLRKGDFFPFRYKGTDISQSFELAFTSLDPAIQNILLSLNIFMQDFHTDTVAWIHEMPIDEVEKNLLQLYSLSLVEKSTYGSYRVHPLLKLFIYHRFHQVELYKKAIKFYQKLLHESCPFERLERELETIEFLFEKCFANKQYGVLLSIWKDLQSILWERGYWILFRKLGEIVYQACLATQNDSYRMELCINELSWCCLWQGEREIAEKYTREGIELAKSTNNAYMRACGQQRLGKLLQVKRDFPQSLEESFAAIKYFRSQSLMQRVADTLPDIAGVYWALEDSKKAIYYLEEALRITSQQNDVHQQAYICIFYGCVYLSRNNFGKAELSFHKSIKLERAYHRAPDAPYWAYLGLGLVAQARKEVEDSIEFFQKAREQRERLGMNQTVIYYRMFFAFFTDLFPEFLI